MKFFNTAGPCEPDVHYMLPPEPRLPDARYLIGRRHYFVVHAPRQTGKTTTLRALARNLTAEGTFLALHFSCETGDALGDDYAATHQSLLWSIRQEAHLQLPDELQPPPAPEAPPERQLSAFLSEWAEWAPRPLVLFIDEIDALRGTSLRLVLRQLREGYPARFKGFPASVVLCGMRNVRDYKAASGGDSTRLASASPFNIKVESFRLGDFTEDETRALYEQHTAETGQPFTEEAVALAFEYSGGQPWLVNALAREAVDKIRVPLDMPISAEHIDLAKERLILERATHLDSLAARLQEPRVRRVIEPLIVGDLPEPDQAYDDEVAYLRDLGLLAPRKPTRIANPIYREVIVRVLGTRTEDSIVDDPRSFVLPDGRLDFRLLLEEFAGFWREHGEVLTSGTAYNEAAPHLVIMAYLHRIVNGGGYIDREYGVGRGRIDLVVRWPYRSAAGKRIWQRHAVELKIWRDGRPNPTAKGLEQLDEYLVRLDLDEGTLVVFDRREDAPPWEERAQFGEAHTPAGRKATVLRA